MMTTKACLGGNARGLPAPAPLPGLTSALSRRRAIFGAVAVAAAPVAVVNSSNTVATEPAAVIDPADARLLELAEAYEALDREVQATPSTDPGYEALTDRYLPLEAEIVETPAGSMIGILAKARLCQRSTIRDCVTDLPLSLADDLVRIHGGVMVAAPPPRIFDPAAYIADLRAAGLAVRALPDGENYAVSARPGRSLGNDYAGVLDKWARAKKADVDPDRRVFHTLMAEA